MKLNKPKFWEQGYWIIPFFLLPLTLLLSLIIYFKKKFTKPLKFNTCVICVGNIYVGGTGKTPTSILLAKELTKLKKKTAIVRKYYQNHFDEHKLITKNFKNLILNKNRQDAIKEFQNKYDVMFLDDGFQDYSIKKNFNIICFNDNQLLGNGFTLPSGPLREKLSSLKEAHIILINGVKNLDFEKKLLNINHKLKFFYSSYKPINVDQFENKNLLAIAGIGNPENFFQLLKENNLKIKKKLIFPDHYEFTNNDINYILKLTKKNNYQIITTEKDFYKIKEPANEMFKFLKVSLEIEKKEELIDLIINSYNENT